MQNPQIPNLPAPFGGVPGVPPQYTAKYKWSIYRFAGTVALGDYKVFSTPQGNNGQGYTSALAPNGLTYRETSQTSDTSKVPTSVNWIVHSVQLYFKPTDDEADVAQLADACTIVLEANDVPIPLGPSEGYPAGGGVFGAADAGSIGTGSTWTNGVPQNSATRPQGERPFLLQAGTQFNFILRLQRYDGVDIALAEDAVIEMGVMLWVWEEKSITQNG